MQRFCLGPRRDWIGCIDQQCNRSGRWDEFVQQFQPLWSHFGIEVGDAREIAARMIEACDKADFNRIQADHENYRDVTRCRLAGNATRLPPATSTATRR